MFEHVQAAPPDAILGLNEAFARDENSEKINLSVGVFKDGSGQTPILACVKAAEQSLVQTETSKNYLGIDGLPGFRQLVPSLLLGDDHVAIGVLPPAHVAQSSARIRGRGPTGAELSLSRHVHQPIGYRGHACQTGDDTEWRRCLPPRIMSQPQRRRPNTRAMAKPCNTHFEPRPDPGGRLCLPGIWQRARRGRLWFAYPLRSMPRGIRLQFILKEFWNVQ